MAALRRCVIAILACLFVCPASYAQLDVFDKFDSWLSDHEAMVAKHGFEALLQVEASKDSHQDSDDHKTIMDHISNGARLAQERKNAILSLVQTDVGLAYSKLLSQDMNQPQVGDDFSVSDGRKSAGLPASVNAFFEMRLDSFANITASSKLLTGRQTSEAESPSIGGHTLARRPGHGGDDSQVSDGGAASEVDPEIGNGESIDGSTDDESTDSSTESDDGIGSLSDEERLVSGADGAAVTSRPINFGPFKYDTLSKGSKKEMTATEGTNLEANDLDQLVYDLKLEDGRSCNLLFTSNPPSSSLNQASVHGFIIPQGSGFLCVVDPQPFRDVDVMGPHGGDVVMFGDTPVEFESRKEMLAATANLFSLRSMSLSPDVSFPLPEESVLGRASAKSMAIITKPLQSEKSVSPDGVPLLHRLEKAGHHQFRGLEEKDNRDNDESSSKAQTQSLVSGKKKVLVGICEFNDVKFQQADKQFFSPNKMEDLVAEMGDWIKEASYDNLELEFTVVPQVLPNVGKWRKVETTKSSAITSRGRDQAISMGKAAAMKIDPKYDVGNFDFHMWVFPPEAGSKTALFHHAWGILGMAVLRGPGLILSASQAEFQNTVLHEFGHNLGLHHSKAWNLVKGVNKLEQYGDKSDVMGGYSGPIDAVPYFQVGQQHWLKWVDDSVIATVDGNDVTAKYEIVSKTGNGKKNAVRGVRVKTADETGWYYIEYSVIGQSQVVRIHRRNALNTMMVLGANLDGALMMFSPSQSFVDGRGAISIECTDYAADKVKVEVKRKLPDAEFHFGDLVGLKGLKRVRKSGLFWRNSAQLNYKCRVEVVYGGVTEKTAKKDAVYDDQKKTWKVAFGGETVSMALSDSKPLIRVQCKENTGVAWFSIGDKELRSIDVTKHDTNHVVQSKKWQGAPLKNGKREATLKYWISTTGIDRL